jgi:hypothetical protein
MFLSSNKAFIPPFSYVRTLPGVQRLPVRRVDNLTAICELIV